MNFLNLAGKIWNKYIDTLIKLLLYLLSYFIVSYLVNYSMPIIFGSLFQTGQWPISLKVSSSKVTADTSSNKSLKCMIDVDPDYRADVLELQWRFNNTSAPIKSGRKYRIQEKNTNSKCKKEFTLTINDVTVEDMGKYSCQSVFFSERLFPFTRTQC